MKIMFYTAHREQGTNMTLTSTAYTYVRIELQVHVIDALQRVHFLVMYWLYPSTSDPSQVTSFRNILFPQV